MRAFNASRSLFNAKGPDGPAWRAAMTVNTWAAVSSSKMRDVDPEASGAVNPNGAGVASPWRGSNGQTAVIDAWGGGVWDEATQTLWIPNGGGHSNYYGNEPYKQPLSTTTPTWARLRNPTGAIGNTGTLNSSTSTDPVYADGRPRSCHGYGNMAFVPGTGPVLARLSVTALTGAGSSNTVWAIDQSTGEASQVFDFTATNCGLSGGTSMGNPYGAACYDPIRARIYSLGNGGAVYLTYCTPGAVPGTWSGGHVGSTPFWVLGNYSRLVYLPTQDRILCATCNGSTGAYEFSLIDATAGTATSITLTGSPASGFASDFGQFGCDWAPELNQLVLWNNTSNTTVISTLTAVGDGLTSWSWGSLTVGGSNAVTPSVKASQGTFGRLAYSSSLRGVVLLNSVDQSTYFFATA
jgi:hypothetical protein